MLKVKLTGHILVPEQDLSAVKAALPEHILLTHQEPGCLDFQVLQDANNRFRFNVYEVFESQSAFEAHQARVRNSEWGRITKDVERFYEVTECS